MPGDSEGHGAVHFLTITATEPELEYEIAHPWCCTQEWVTWDGIPRYQRWTCDVGEHLCEAGLESAIYGIYGHEPLEPGMYLIRGWWRKYYVWDMGYEWDAGLEIVSFLGPVPVTDDLSPGRATRGGDLPESQNNGGSADDELSEPTRDQAWDSQAIGQKLHPDKQDPSVNWG